MLNAAINGVTPAVCRSIDGSGVFVADSSILAVNVSAHELNVLVGRISAPRLAPYTSDARGDVRAAVRLYDWNISIGAALFEDLSRLEVVIRNALSAALQALEEAAGWTVPWYEHNSTFTGPARRALSDARERASVGNRSATHDRIVSELNFGRRQAHRAQIGIASMLSDRRYLRLPR